MKLKYVLATAGVIILLGMWLYAVNSQEEYSKTDVYIIEQFIEDGVTLEGGAPERYDVNKDGVINMDDYYAVAYLLND